MKKFIAAIAIAALASVAYGQQNVSIVDGVVTLNGSFSQLAGIEVQSKTPTLGRAGYEAAPGVILPVGQASFPSETPTQYAYGILGAANRIDIEGSTPTAVTYSGDNAQADLFAVIDGQEVAGAVALGLGNDSPAAFPVVPEPATGLMAAFGLVGLLGLRRRR